MRTRGERDARPQGHAAGQSYAAEAGCYLSYCSHDSPHFVDIKETAEGCLGSLSDLLSVVQLSRGNNTALRPHPVKAIYRIPALTAVVNRIAALIN
jgi:hypothetical protein